MPVNERLQTIKRHLTANHAENQTIIHTKSTIPKCRYVMFIIKFVSSETMAEFDF